MLLIRSMSNLVPSPADGVMDVSPSSSLYPDLGGVDMEESDPLPPLQSTGKARAPPKRPPPPRSGSISGSLVVSPTMASKMVSLCVFVCGCVRVCVCVCVCVCMCELSHA